jgi:hypothetical protein
MASPSTTLKPKALECPKCGGTVELRTFGRALSAVCGNCLCALGTKDSNLEIISKFHEKFRVEPMIRLGARGIVKGDRFEAAGFQDRYIEVEGEQYHWQEYLLFNPYKGFRYLTHYRGHWNFVRPMSDVPEPRPRRGRKACAWQGRTYSHFQTAEAQTAFVAGEFPWRIQAGDKVLTEDYTSAPYSLSAEITDEEVTWSAGEYMAGDEVWKAFQIDGSAPQPEGIYFNQPSPYGPVIRETWRLFFLLLVALVGVGVLARVLMQNSEVFSRDYEFQPGGSNVASFVTPVFDLTGRTSNLEIRTATDLTNQWIYLNYTLINDQTGTAYDIGRMMSYYGDEGSRADSAMIPVVPAGRYYLRVEPEWQPDPGTVPGAMTPLPQRVKYRVMVRRDVPVYWPAFVILILLILPPLWRSMQAGMFEAARWKESGYAS